MKVKDLILSNDFYVVTTLIPMATLSPFRGIGCKESMRCPNRICLLDEGVFVDLGNKKEYKQTSDWDVARVKPGDSRPLADYYYSNGIAIPTFNKDIRRVHKNVRSLLKSDVFEFWGITEKMNNVVVLDAIIPALRIGGMEEADLLESRICLEESDKYIDLENNTCYYKNVGLGVNRPSPGTIRPLSSYFYSNGIAKKEDSKNAVVYQKIRDYISKCK